MVLEKQQLHIRFYLKLLNVRNSLMLMKLQKDYPLFNPKKLPSNLDE